MVLGHWLACGLFGGTDAEKFTTDPAGPIKDAVRAFYEIAVYPPESGPFDAAAVFSGAQINGYWQPSGDVKWQPVTVAVLDTRVTLSTGGAQTWFTTTWVHVTNQTEAKLTIQSMPTARVRLSLDDTVLFDDSANVEVPENEGVKTATVPATLPPV